MTDEERWVLPAPLGVDEATAAAIFSDWEHGATFDELIRTYDMDRAAIRKVIFAREMIKGGPSSTLVPVGGTAASPVVAGELIAVGASHLPAHYRGEGPPPGSPQDVIDNWLPDSAKRLILRGKSEHTIKAYFQAFGWWTRWATANHVTVMPAPQNAVIRMLDWWETFPVHVGCTGKKQTSGEPCTGHRPSPSAVWILYSALKWFHGLGEPPIPLELGVKLSDAIAGYIKQLKDDGWRQTKAPRAYPDDVRAMIDALDVLSAEPPDWWNPDARFDGDEEEDDRPIWLPPTRVDMLRALVLGGYYTGGRASDLARYRIPDVVRFPGGLDLTLARSKGTKGDRQEEHRTIHADLASPQYCGMVALERWIARLAANGITQGAVFRPVHKRGSIVRGAPDALSYMADVTGLSRQARLVAKLAWLASGKRILQEWPRFTIHSFRRGRVQQLLEEGADVWDVEEELGWAHGGAIKFYRAEVVRQAATAANAKGML